MIFNRGAPITSEDIINALSGKQGGNKRPGESDELSLRDWARRTLTSLSGEHLFEICMDRFAAILISEALNMTGGNRSQAAKLLGLSRPTLHAKIDKYHLKLETSVTEE